MSDIVILIGAVCTGLTGIAIFLGWAYRSIRKVHHAVMIQHEWISETRELINYEFRQNSGHSALDLIRRIPELEKEIGELKIVITSLRQELEIA